MPHASQASHATATATAQSRRIAIAGDSSVASRALLNRDGKLWIEHGGERYLLRRTANDRLILTK